jgi:PAS domain S-box-containing protein
MSAATQKFDSVDQLSGDDLLSLLIETATNHALFTLDLNGIVTSWNPGAERIIGYRAREIIGQSFARFHTDADQAARKPSLTLEHALAHGRYEEEGVRVRKDGSAFPAEVVIYPIRRKSGDLVGFAKIARDVTGRVERERAEAASAAKSRLLAQLGHEFRTPLNAIIGFSEVMQQKIYGELGHPRYASYIDDIHASGLHLFRLVEAILDLARVETDRAVPIWQPIDLNAEIAYVIRLMRDRAEGSGIRLMRSSTGDYAAFEADERMVRQCLINLVDNALKYSPAGTRVTVGVERKGSWLYLTVTDQGRGIAKNEIDRAMEPFRQVGEDVEHRRDGVGLGLALVKSFCEAHGGNLTIDSELGRGTRVVARFPYPRGRPSPAR